MKRSSSSKTISSLTLFIGLSIFIPAQGQTILIDFGAVSTTSAEWNNVGGNSSSSNIADLDDTLENPTGIALNVSSGNFGGVGNWNGTVAANGAMFTPFQTATAITDGIYANAGNIGTLSFTGLDSSKTYELTLTAARSNAEERYTRYGVTGHTSQILQVAGDSPYAGTGTTIWNNDDYITFSGITGVSSLNLTVEGNRASDFTGINTWGYVNALQLSVIPEPSTFALLGLALLGLITLRRR